MRSAGVTLDDKEKIRWQNQKSSMPQKARGRNGPSSKAGRVPQPGKSASKGAIFGSLRTRSFSDSDTDSDTERHRTLLAAHHFLLALGFQVLLCCLQTVLLIVNISGLFDHLVCLWRPC